MKYTRKVKIGDSDITIEEEVRSLHEFWQRMAFWDDMPRECNGNADVRFKFRVTAEDNYEYYSLYCPSKDMEFRFGQKQDRDKTLFPKWKEGWVKRGTAQLHNDNPITADDLREVMRKNGIKTIPDAESAIKEIIGKAILPDKCSQQELDKLYREFAQRLGGK